MRMKKIAENTNINTRKKYKYKKSIIKKKTMNQRMEIKERESITNNIT